MNYKNHAWQFVYTNIQLSGAVHLNLKYFHNTSIFVLLSCGLIYPIFEKMLSRILEALKKKYNNENSNVNIKI